MESLQDLTRVRIDAPQVAVVAFESGVPELAIDPGDSCNEAVGFDSGKNRTGAGVDLMDLPVPILPHPECPFGPRKPRPGAPRRGNRCEHAAGVRINLLDAVVRKLEQVMTVKSRSSMGSHIDPADSLPSLSIESLHLVSRR